MEYELIIDSKSFRVSSNLTNYNFDFSEYKELYNIDIALTAIDVSGNRSKTLFSNFEVPDTSGPRTDEEEIITVVERTDSLIHISWPSYEDSSGIKAYILRYTDLSSNEKTFDIEVFENKYIFDNLNNNKYSVSIFAVDNAGNTTICCSKVIEAKDQIKPNGVKILP